MDTITAFSRTHAERGSYDRRRVDGSSVTDLFDRLYRETGEMARRFGKEIRFEVIAWSNLTIAADPNPILESMVQALRWCLASEDTLSVTVRAYPCHDNVWAVFDIQADLTSGKLSQPEAWKPTFGYLRTAVQRMDGEWEPVVSYSECRRITFRLPQSVKPASERKPRLLHAS